VNKRERVIKALNFEKTDRIPRYEIFLPEFIEKWEKCKNIGKITNIYDYYPKIDIGTVLADQDGPFPSLKRIEKRESHSYYERDSWGRLLLKKDDAYFEKELEVIFDEKGKLDKIKFEEIDLNEKHKSLKEYSKRLEEKFAPVSGVLGLFMGCSRLRGDVQFLTDIVEDKSFCKELVSRLTNYIKYLGLSVAEATDTKDTAIWVYDELAGKDKPIISPDSFSDIFLLYYKDMLNFWKEQGIKNIILHCDGNCSPLIELIIEAGFTGIQGIYPSTGMKLPDIKGKYDNRLVLIGGICNIETLCNSSYKDIKKQIEEIIEVAKEGGVIIGAHSIGDDVPIENYEYYYSILNEFDDNW